MDEKDVTPRLADARWKFYQALRAANPPAGPDGERYNFMVADAALDLAVAVLAEKKEGEADAVASTTVSTR